MSLLDIVNYLKIDDVSRASKNQEHLTDLKERAEHLKKTTGYEPLSWHEFKQTNSPQDKPNTLGNLLLGALIGVGVGLTAGFIATGLMLPFALVGGTLGAAIGAFSDTENTRRDTLVTKYERYLNDFETSVARSRGPVRIVGLEKTKTTHAADLAAERQQSQGPAITL